MVLTNFEQALGDLSCVLKPGNKTGSNAADTTTTPNPRATTMHSLWSLLQTWNVLPVVCAEWRTTFILASEGQTGQAQALSVWKIAGEILSFMLAEKKRDF